MPRQKGAQPHQIAWAKKAYAFFIQKGESNAYFTKMDIVQATGYTESVVRSHAGKRWKWFLVPSGNGYYCNKLNCSEEEFIKGHTQKWEPSEPITIYVCMPLDKKKLFRWLLLLMVVDQWYRVSGKYKAKIWRSLLPIA